MYWCYNCEKKFAEPKKIKTNQATLFGLPRLSDPQITLDTCPYCGSENVEREEEENE